jgi:hypothetical protein
MVVRCGSVRGVRGGSTVGGRVRSRIGLGIGLVVWRVEWGAGCAGSGREEVDIFCCSVVVEILVCSLVFGPNECEPCRGEVASGNHGMTI